jgi:hypothetical protein
MCGFIGLKDKILLNIYGGLYMILKKLVTLLDGLS